MGRDLGGFHNRMARRIKGRQLRRLQDGILDYHPLGEAMRKAALEELEAYILMRQNKDAQYIETRSILDL